MGMPPHYATQEAVVIVQQGTALLSLLHKEHTLTKGDHFIIPARVSHSLMLKTDFEAIAVMLTDTAIEFE